LNTIIALATGRPYHATFLSKRTFLMSAYAVSRLNEKGLIMGFLNGETSCMTDTLCLCDPS